MTEKHKGLPERAFFALLAREAIAVPVTEHVFASPRKWRFDYAWPTDRLALEVEGGVWRKGGGAHTHPTKFLKDMDKYNAAAILGWRVLRTTPDELIKRPVNVVAMVREALTR